MNQLFCTILLIVIAARLNTRGENLTLDVEDACRVALTNNPSLRAAVLTIDEAKARLLDAGRFRSPEFESSFAPNIDGRERSFSAGFNQAFPLTRRLASEKKLSRMNITLAEAEVDEFKRILALQVRTTAIQLWALDAQRQLKDRQLENSRSLESSAREAANLGEGSQLTLSQLQLESGGLAASRASIERDQSQTAASLRILLGLDPSSTLTINPTAGAIPILPPETASPTNRADFRAAVARAAAAREKITLARSSRWEDITVGLFTEMDRNEDYPIGLETDHIVGLRVSLPLPIWNRRKGLLAEAEAGSARANLEFASLRARIEFDLALAITQFKNETALLNTLTNDLLPKARQLEEQFFQLQREGQVPFADVLRAREKRLELEAAELNAQRDVHLAYARYLAAIGRDQ